MSDDLSQLPDYAGGWLMPIVCGGREKSPHAPPALLSHAYEDESGQIRYTAHPATVRQTRQSAAVGLPGWSRESIRFICPVCKATPTVDRRRWSTILEEARHADLSVFFVSALDRPLP